MKHKSGTGFPISFIITLLFFMSCLFSQYLNILSRNKSLAFMTYKSNISSRIQFSPLLHWAEFPQQTLLLPLSFSYSVFILPNTYLSIEISTYKFCSAISTQVSVKQIFLLHFKSQVYIFKIQTFQQVQAQFTPKII